MLENLKKENHLLRILLILLISAVGLYLLDVFLKVIGNFSDILIILAISWLLSFILEPIVETIQKMTHFSKVASALLGYVIVLELLVAGIFLLIPIITTQTQTLSSVIPKQLDSAPQFIKHWGDILFSYLNDSITYLPSAASYLFSVIIILIISFYFIVDKEKINREIYFLTPHKWHQRVKFIENLINNSFASFLRVQFLFGVITGFATWIVLRIMGIDFAASVGVLAGLLAMIPFVGPIFAIIPPLPVAFLESPTKGLIVFLILLVIEQITFNVLGPKLFSKVFKISPIIVLISFLVGAKLAGWVGAIFAIPVVGIVAVIIKQITYNYFNSKR